MFIKGIFLTIAAGIVLLVGGTVDNEHPTHSATISHQSVLADDNPGPVIVGP